MFPARRQVLSTLIIAGALAATIGAVPQNRVDDLIARNIQAKGGLDKVQSVFSIKQTSTMSMNGKEAKTTSYSKRPNLQRQEMRVEGKTVINAFDGEMAWIVNPFMGAERPVIVSGPQVDMIKEQSMFDGLLMNLKDLGYTATAEGMESQGDRNLIHIKLVSVTKQVRHVYLDSTTYLEAKLSSEQNQMKLDQELLDYRDVDGIKMPFLIRTLINGVLQSEIKIDKVELNVKMGDELFRIPKES
jgi:outer membrane lipoprotein-sorting protein